MINPKMHKEGSPEWVLAKFFKAWKKRAWKQMVDYIRPSWLRIYVEPYKWLKLTFNPELIDARLIQANARTPAVTVYQVEIEYKAPLAIAKKVVSEIRLYSELTSLQETEWGVDPTTIILEIEPRKAEPKSVADEEAEKKPVKKTRKTPRKSRSKK